jgi:glycolate dehydrogenase FAD-binding subunit
VAVFSPASVKEAGEVVAWAVAEEQPLELAGGGSKRGLGRPMQVSNMLDLSRLSGIAGYEPAELVLTAATGTPLDAIEAELAARRQMLAFEPGDWRALLGTTERRQTIGGVVSCNLSGPRRIRAGAPRDHLLGFHAINGRGEAFKAGGKVVKNVTGYDLSKLVAGAYGTLAALTEVSLKVLPRPEDTRSVVVWGLDPCPAIRALGEGLNSPHEVSGAAHLPSGLAVRSGVAPISGAGTAATVLRLEGFAPSVEYRCRALRDALTAFGPTDELAPEDSGRLWREIGDGALLAEPRERVVWRLSVPPSEAPAIAGAIHAGVEAEMLFDWGGGLIWASVGADAPDGGAAALRGALAARRAEPGGGGHATLIRAPESLRAAVDVFEPLPGPLAALSARVKENFDPRRVLNPGRMYAGV